MTLIRQEVFGEWDAPFNHIKDRLGVKPALRSVA